MEDIHTSEDNYVPPLILTSLVRDKLKKAAKWSKYLAFIMFINAGFMIFGLIISMLYGKNVLLSEPWLLSDMGGLGALFGDFDTLSSILAIILTLLPASFLYGFSNNMNKALQLGDQERLFYSFVNLKSLFKFYVLLIIISIVITVLFFAGSIFSLFFLDYDPASFG